MIKLEAIYRYPIKSLSGQALDKVQLRHNQPIIYDRHWALAHASSPIKSQMASWTFKHDFLNLCRDNKLAQLQSDFDEKSLKLSLSRKGRMLVQGRMDDAMGRMLIQDFLSNFLGAGSRSNPTIIEAAPDQHFQDHKHGYFSLINLASLQDLQDRVMRMPINKMRFRGNFYISGLKPWQEFDLVGQTIEFNQTRFKILEPIERCAATNVNIEHGQQAGTQDMNIPLGLRRALGHINCGVFLGLEQEGELSNHETARIA